MPPPTPPTPPPPLPDELLEEILLRLPPEDPGCLFRASLVCKPWRSRLTGSAFARLYREFHGTPPLLGFFENDKTVFCWFTPLSPTSPFLPVHPDHRDLFVLDSRHGRVLLNSVGPEGESLDLIVWDPVGRRKWGLPYPEFDDWTTVPDDAAVLCAVDDCDHLDCHGAPFLVVYVRTDEDGVAHACVYSSESCAWSPVTSCEHPNSILEVMTCWPKAHVGDAVYFSCTSSKIILRYDLFTQELSMITWPAMYKWENANHHILMRTEDGVLGCARLQESRLELWSMESHTDGTVKWVLSRVVELENWLPSRPTHVTRFVDGVGIFFVRTNLGIFTVELKSGRVKKISNSKDQVIPYMSFYTPDQSGGIMPPSTMTSSSENVETTQDEHHDLLLQHSSGEVGDVKEKRVEKGEEDCERKEGGWHEEGSVEYWEWKGEKAAQKLFEKGSKAIDEGHFVAAKKFLHRALKSRVLFYGRLSPMCFSTYYKYGCALLHIAQAKIAPYHEDLVEGSASRDDTGSAKASGSNVRKDLDLACKMLNIARAILEKYHCISMEKVLTFCALAEVSMEREDIDYSLRACFKALAILEHLVEPDHCRIVLLNLYIFLSLKSASKIPDALPYALKVFSLYKSRMEKLIRAKEALLAVKGDNASAAEIGSEISSLDNEIESLFNIFSVLEEKLEDLGYKKH